MARSNFFRMVHAEDRDAVKAAVEQAVVGEAVYRVDHRVVRGDGAIRWVHEHAGVVRDVAGKPVRLVGVVQDITARKEAEAQLLRLAHYDKLTQLPDRTLSLTAFCSRSHILAMPGALSQ